MKDYSTYYNRQDGWVGTNFERVSRDVYSYGLGYYNQDFTAIGGSGAIAMNQAVYQHPPGADNTGRQLFNGNISHTEVAMSKIDYGAAKGYSYGYDQLNRLVFMNQHTVSGSTWSNSNIISAYAESIAYDANGNILKYLRKGANGAAGPLDMDSLNYKYNRDVNGNLVDNRLNHVRDQVNSGNYAVDIDNQSNNNYTYDKIGNLKTDVAETISNIDWTVYGKIKGILKSSSTVTIQYGYDPGGNRTHKKVTTSSEKTDEEINTWYIRDAQGNVLAIYSKKNTEAIKWDEQHLYGSSRLGMWNWDTIVPAAPPVVGSNGTPIYDSLLCGSRTYELSNHLGNVMVTVSDRKLGVDNNSDGVIDYYTADVITANDFYPFGLDMPGRKFGAVGRYGFNGKERDKDLNSLTAYDLKFRIYNPAIGKFLSVDPLTKDFPFYSPYQYAGNTPIWCIDLDGREPLPYTEWEHGGWSKIENFKKIQGSKNHIKVVNFGDIFNDGHNYVAIRDQKIEGKWWYGSYDDQVGSLGNAQKGNWKLYSSGNNNYDSWTPEGWEADDEQIKSRARHMGAFGEGLENVIIQGVIFGVTGPLGAAGSWGSRLVINGTMEVGINGRNADVADIITNSLPGMGGLVGVGTNSFLDWSPASSDPRQQKPSSILFPDSKITSHKSLKATATDIITGVTFEGMKFFPKKAIPNLTTKQKNLVDISNDLQEKVINKVIKNGVESQE
jgi:RHS repeat-associated protein